MTTPADVPLPPGAKFPLGRVVVTPAAAEWLPAETFARALKRHQAGDWGDASPGSETAWDNAEALLRGWAVFSFYFRQSPGFRIITSGDRSTTTVSMPWDVYRRSPPARAA
jgi:hypothetical protein